MATKDFSDALLLKAELHKKSILSFIHEEGKDRRLAFIDCLVQRMDNRLIRSVHNKDTNTGVCINYNGI